MGRVQDLVTQAMGIASLPAQLARDVLQVCQNARQMVSDIQGQAIITGKAYMQVGSKAVDTFTGSQSWLGWSATQDRASQSASAQAETAEIYSQLQTQKDAVVAESKRLEAQAREYLEQTYLDVYIAREGDTLRKIAARYYGDAGLWQVIAEANELDGDGLSAGMVLLIPKLGRAQ
jgi:nucleoid-associated protein YgaU